MSDKLKAVRSKRRERARLVYHAFVNAKDAWPDLTFREFLTNPYFKRHGALWL